MVIGKVMKDKCVVCKEDSVYDLDENIICRLAYIIGVGQLCFECYDEIYIKSKNKKEVKNENVTMVGLRQILRDVKWNRFFTKRSSYGISSIFRVFKS